MMNLALLLGLSYCSLTFVTPVQRRQHVVRCNERQAAAADDDMMMVRVVSSEVRYGSSD